tara:strand:+ start:212 stop:355 length:144 start_codon:yes stop_codon:yes gene_type:complete
MGLIINVNVKEMKAVEKIKRENSKANRWKYILFVYYRYLTESKSFYL